MSIRKRNDAPSDNAPSDDIISGAPEKTAKKFADTQAGFFVRIAGVLVAVCVCVALLLSVVNALTKDKIAENTARERESAMNTVYPGAEYALYEGDAGEDVKAVYTASLSGSVCGYCVQIETSGFGGTIEMMVGVSTEGKIDGVSIISMSETPGLGSRVNNQEYLSGYGGQSAPVKFGGGIDALSGATVTSKAVLAGVNKAADAVTSHILKGGESSEG